MPLFIASYDYTDDAQAQALVRPRHREFLAGLGPVLVASGPTDANGAVLVLEAGSAEEVGRLLDDDPFRAAGFIAQRRVVGWTPVLGRLVESGAIAGPATT